MRNTLRILALIALINAASSSTCPIRSLLGTNQFMVIGSRACSQIVETGLTDGTCPKHLQHVCCVAWCLNLEIVTDLCPILIYWCPIIPKSATDRFKKLTFAAAYRTEWVSGVQAHLMRDIYGKAAPRILYVGKYVQHTSKSPLIFAYVDAINMPYKVNSTYFTLPDIPHKTLNTAFLSEYHIAGLKYIIFDTRSKFLYVIKPSAQVSVYLMDSDLSAGTKYPQLISTGGVENTKDRENYVADPYTHQVYYTRRRDGFNDLYRLPIEDLLSSFYNGFDGERITTFNDTRRLISVSDGILVSRMVINDAVTTLFRDLNVNGTDECFCDHKSLSGMETNFLILRDWDYCMIRYGMDRNFCDSERQELINAENLNVTIDDELDYQFIALWVLLILLTIFIILCIYSSTRISHYRRKYEETSEKCQFLQEQVATALPYYSTNVGYTSEMDVTVDRYN